MRYANPLVSLCFIVITFSRVLCEDVNDIEMRFDFYSQVKALHGLRLSTNPSSAEIGASFLSAASGEPAISFPALLQLWVCGQDQAVELQWWKKRDRATRMLVISLEYCVKSEVLSNAPGFDSGAQRFAEAERAERLEELAFVNERLPSIAATLEKILESSLQGDFKERAEVLAPFAGKAKRGGGKPFDSTSPRLVNLWIIEMRKSPAGQ